MRITRLSRSALSLLLALMLLVSTVPVTAGALEATLSSEGNGSGSFASTADEPQKKVRLTGAVTNYSLWVGSTQVTAANRNDILGDGGKAKFDPATNTLILDEPVISGSHAYNDYHNARIYSTDIDLHVTGSYHENSEGTSHGIYVNNGSVTFDGNFGFYAKRGDYGWGVWVKNEVTVSSGTLESTGDFSGILCSALTVRERACIRARSLSSGGAAVSTSGTKGLTLEGRTAIIEPENSRFETGVIHDSNDNRADYVYIDTPYSLWLGDTLVTASNCEDILGDGSAVYDPDTSVLTLNNPTVTSTHNNSIIFAKDIDLTIKGSCDLTDTDAVFGLNMESDDHNLSSTNTGSLTLDGDFSFNTGVSGIGVSVVGPFTVLAGRLKAEGGWGIRCRGKLTVGNNVECLEMTGGGQNAKAIFLIGTDYSFGSGIAVRTPENSRIRAASIYDSDYNIATHAVIGPETLYNIWVDGVRVTSANSDDILRDGGNAKYDRAASTLTLNDITLSGQYNGASIYAENTPLKLAGSANMTEAAADYGVYSTGGAGSLTFSGDFTFRGKESAVKAQSAGVTVESGSLSAFSANAYAIYGMTFTAAAGAGRIEAQTSASSALRYVQNNGYSVATGIFIKTPSTGSYGVNSVLDTNGNPAKHVVLEPNTYNIWVGGVRVTSTNLYDILNDGASARYIPGNNELKLTNPTISGTYNGAKIYCDRSDLNITGSYRAPENDTADYGVYCRGRNNLTLDGSFTFRGSIFGVYGGVTSMKGSIKLSGATGVLCSSLSVSGENSVIEIENNASGNTALKVSAGALSLSDGLGAVEPENGGFSGADYTANGSPAGRVVIRKPNVYDLWLGGTRVTELNKSNILGNGKASFDPSTGTLTLNNPGISGYKLYDSGDDGTTTKIYAENIDLKLKGSFNYSGDSCAVCLFVQDGSLTLDGSFNFDGADSGIVATGAVALTPGSRVRSTGGITAGLVTDGGIVMQNDLFADTSLELEGGYYALINQSYSLSPSDKIAVTLPDSGASGSIINGNIYMPNGMTKASHTVLYLHGAIDGEGTAQAPYLIHSAEEWNDLAGCIASGIELNGKHFELASDISVSAMTGTSEHPFAGVFNGGGHTLTVDLSSSDEGCAPFGYINGATIKNLKVTGNVSGGSKSSGLVGVAGGTGNLIENCEVSADIESSGMYVGGFVGYGGTSQITITGCAFSGSIGSGSHGGVFWGWGEQGAQPVISGCIDLSDTNYPIGSGYPQNPTVTNTYYSNHVKYNDNTVPWYSTGELARVISGSNAALTLSGNSANGLTYNGTIYAAHRDTVTLNVSPSDIEYSSTSGTFTQNGGVCTLTMPDEDVVILPKNEMIFNINTDPQMQNGTVTASKAKTCQGDTVTLTAVPDPGYVLNAFSVTDSSNRPVTVTGNTFIMPHGDVTVSATFTQIYSFNSSTGELRLMSGAFNKYSKWGSDVDPDGVLSVTAESGVSFTGDCSGMFMGFVNCESMDLSNIDTSAMTSAKNMFADCHSLTSTGSEEWTTSKITNMSGMFSGCSSLSELLLNYWSTPRVTDMTEMFKNCTSLTALDMSWFNVGSQTAVTDMFKGDSVLKTVTISPAMSITAEMRLNNGGDGWVDISDSRVTVSGDGEFAVIAAPTYYPTTYSWTSVRAGAKYSFNSATGVLTINWGEYSSANKWSDVNSADIRKIVIPQDLNKPPVRFTGSCRGMFESLSNCTSIDLRGADTSEVTDMSCMFKYCGALNTLKVSGWNTSQVTDMSGAFGFCSSLSELDLTGWSTSAVTDMSAVFEGCSSLEELDLSGFDTSLVEDMSNMFCGCASLTGLELSGFNTESVSNMSEMFCGCESLEALDLKTWNTPCLEETDYMFGECSSLALLDVSGFDTSDVVAMGRMFEGCSSIKSLDLSGWNTSSANEMWEMFSGCESLETLILTSFNTSNIDSMSYMFSDCSSLVSLDLSGFNTSNVFDMNSMFANCTSLTRLDLSGWNTSNVWTMRGMFDNCSSLKALDLSSFTTECANDFAYMFRDCASLARLDLSSFECAAATMTTEMFKGCTNLTELDISGIGIISEGEEITWAYEMFSECDALRRLAVSADTEITEEMYLNNGYPDDPGWIINGGTDVISGDGEYAMISAPAAVSVYEWKHSVQTGDTNLDGVIDIRDVTAIQRHLADLEAIPDLFLILADTNGDGNVDISDATHLQKYLARYDVVLGEQTQTNS